MRVTLIDGGSLSAGSHWGGCRGLSYAGTPLASGVLFARLVTVDGTRTRKLMFV